VCIARFPPPTCQISPERIGTQDEGCGRGRSKSTGRAVGKIVCLWSRAVWVGIHARGTLSRKLEEQSGLHPTPRREVAMIRGCGKAWEIGWMARGSVWGARTERMTPGDGTPASCRVAPTTFHEAPACVGQGRAMSRQRGDPRSPCQVWSIPPLSPNLSNSVGRSLKLFSCHSQYCRRWHSCPRIVSVPRDLRKDVWCR
jgi:hypothetical protein